MEHEVTIQMYEWRTDETVTVEVTEEPLLVNMYSLEDMWFEVNIHFEDGAEHYAQYDEEKLRWVSGDN